MATLNPTLTAEFQSGQDIGWYGSILYVTPELSASESEIRMLIGTQSGHRRSHPATLWQVDQHLFAQDSPPRVPADP